MKVAVVGATGLVGQKMLQVLEERAFPLETLIPVASEKSVGSTVSYRKESIPVCSWQDALAQKPTLALFSAGGMVSREIAARFTAAGCRVIDNSSAWRMEPHVPLIVPEVNAEVLTENDYLIANPNCSTIQMVLILHPLQKRYGLKRVVVSTYQSVTGTGKKAVEQLMGERNGSPHTKAYPHPIDLNIIPHIDVFLDNGYTKEEMKLILESRKILGLPELRLTATTVRIPVLGGHSESVNIELERAYDLEEVRELLANSPGVKLYDQPMLNEYPMPILVHEQDETWVGRIRRDESVENGLNCWIVADNLRKGAATNAVQIAEYLLQQSWLNK